MEEIINQLLELYALGTVMGIGLMMIFGCLTSAIGFLAGKMKSI